MKTIQNKFVSLSVDAKGRLASLKNKVTGSELIMHKEAAEGWRIVIPSGRHTLDFLYASGQKPNNITVRRNGDAQILTIAYEALCTGRETLPIQAEFSFELTDAAPYVRARVSIRNNSLRQVDEIEFPVVGGLGGFKGKGNSREIQLVDISKATWAGGRFCGDVLNHSFPYTGRESDQYCSEQERAMWEDQQQGLSGLSFYGATEGLYAGYHTTTPQDFVFKVE